MKNLKETEAVARLITCCVNMPYVIALTGELGSGKTAFVQTMAKTQGITAPVQSPTFTLVNEYTFSEGQLIHADLYRLNSEAEAKELGLSDYFTRPNTITAVEWADRFPKLIPFEALWVGIEVVGDHRVITLHSDSETVWQNLEMGAV